MSEIVTLHAPFSGWLSGLDEVPDEVFAGRMMGDGVAIDPLGGELVAPCDATIISVAPTRHAVTLRSTNGAEILIHIGLETVALGGNGFRALVSAGQEVRSGDRLIAFDLDAVAVAAPSLITPIVITNTDAFLFTASAPGAIAAGDPIGTVAPVAQGVESKANDGVREQASAEIEVTLPNGIHARPAARIAAAAKAFPADIRLHFKGREAKAGSPVSVMALDIRSGDRVEIRADGRRAEEAISALSRLIVQELPALEAHAHAMQRPLRAAATAESEAGQLRGVCAVPGLSIGPAFHLHAQREEVQRQGAGVAQEGAALAAAVEKVRHALLAATSGADATAAGIAAAHLELIDDDDILAAAAHGIARDESAGFAFRAAIAEVAERLTSTGNPLLIERIDDLHDLERQVLAVLAGKDPNALPDVPAGAIVLADELLPSQVIALSGTAAGLCTAGGGPTSHMAILAAAAGLPTVVALGSGLASISEGATLLLEATSARVTVAPAADILDAARARIAAAEVTRSADAAAASAECRTADGTRIELFANLASTREAEAAVAAGAEGCGLLRTEFLFLDRATAPDEEEQRLAYQGVADALGGRPLIVRTLDIGGDKALAYLPIPSEDNPALGLRGVRVSLWRPQLLDEQLRAIVRVQPAGQCRIMVPMVSNVDEIRAVRGRLEAVANSLGVTAPPLGIMIETPAAALLADQLAAEADFFSVGTNDLTQYALAMDRTNPAVAAHVDAFHPAVLRLIAGAAAAASEAGRTIGACGGLASDPDGAILLVGLGLTELSVTPAAIGSVKARLRGITLDRCREIAAAALRQISPQAVRTMLAEASQHSSTGLSA